MTYREAAIVLKLFQRSVWPERQRQAINMAIELLEKEATKSEEAESVEVKDI